MTILIWVSRSLRLLPCPQLIATSDIPLAAVTRVALGSVNRNLVNNVLADASCNLKMDVVARSYGSRSYLDINEMAEAI